MSLFTHRSGHTGLLPMIGPVEKNEATKPTLYSEPDIYELLEAYAHAKWLT
jgi:hypothetical protein